MKKNSNPQDFEPKTDIYIEDKLSWVEK